MTVPEGFQFSQGNLQDFLDCKRRFFLKYVQRVAWPAAQSEPVRESERLATLGAGFHHLAHQALVAIPPEHLRPLILARLEISPELERWWVNFLEFLPSLQKNDALGGLVRMLPEVSMNMPFLSYRLVGKFDLLVIYENGAVIIDWKTSTRKPRRGWLAQRMQTRLYPYLLCRAAGGIFGENVILPSQVQLIYWFAEFPDQPEVFPYGQTQLEKDEASLQVALEEIQRLESDDFLMTDKLERCSFCVYRSLCDRGVKAGSLEEQETEIGEGDLVSGPNFEQIAEIAF